MRGGELADRALAHAGDRLDSRDHAWVQELVYGTFRMRGRLDHILASFVRSGLESLDPTVLDILRLGAYQLLEMGSVPPYAAVSQSVELARSAGAGRASGLVNGVLQSLRRGASGVLFPSFEQEPVEHLVHWGSHPRWLVERWVERWGAEEAGRLVDANNTRPDLYLRPIGVSAPKAIQRLKGAGVEAERVEYFPDSVRVDPAGGPLEALGVLPSVVQDPAAAMVVRYADFPTGSRVVDLSAAPGGKTIGLAGNGYEVVASDLSLGRMRRVRANAKRAEVVDRVAYVVSDGRFPPFREVDGVLLDAPCAGTGTLRRHADGRWRITEVDLSALAKLQSELLDSAAGLVRPGGVLVYSTCSLEPEENEQQVERFLKKHEKFRLAPTDTVSEASMSRDGYLSVLPQRHGVDGAFAARLLRSA